MRTLKIIVFVLFCSSFSLLKGQDQLDSIQFTENSYLQLVLENHPLAKKAINLKDYGEFSIMAAKGGFDPYLYSKNKQKYYKGTNYYLLSNSGINLPTRLGVSLQAGYDWNEGEYLNNENTLPQNGLWYAGVSVPLLQGLLIDENRASLQKAFLDKDYYENQSQLLLNNLLLEATNYYWTWVQMSHKKEVIEEAYQFAQTNFLNYKTAYQQGDKPAIDTLEAFIQLQNFEVQKQQIANDLQSATLTLLTFIWNDANQIANEVGSTPVTIRTKPTPIIDSLVSNQEELIAKHPELQSYNIKVQQLSIDNRMKREKLKPKLNVEYNLLQNPSNGISEIRGLDNYKWGLSFSFPIFLRQERGELQMSNIKLENTNYEYLQKRQSITNKARQYEFAFKNVSEQLATYTSVVNQYEMLLKAEVRKFEIGESSIFLINYRQISLVNAELKLIELKTKYNMYYRQWLHSLGAPSELWLAQ